MNPLTALNLINKEFIEANKKFELFTSPHEGYAVIKEELDELWDEIKNNNKRRFKDEAKQVGAMALKFMCSCCDEPIDNQLHTVDLARLTTKEKV